MRYQVEPIYEAGVLRWAVYTMAAGIKVRHRGFDSRADALAYAAGVNARCLANPNREAVRESRRVLSGRVPFGRRGRTIRVTPFQD